MRARLLMAGEYRRKERERKQYPVLPKDAYPGTRSTPFSIELDKPWMIREYQRYLDSINPEWLTTTPGTGTGTGGYHADNISALAATASDNYQFDFDGKNISVL